MWAKTDNAPGSPPPLLTPAPSKAPFERPIEIAVAVIALLGLPKLVSDLQGDEPLYITGGLAIIMLAHILVAVEALRPSRLGWPIVVLTIVGTTVMVGCQLLDPAHLHGHWRTDAWYGTLLTFAILLRPKGRELPILTALTVTGFVLIASTKELDWINQSLDLVFTASSLSLVWLARLVTITMIDEYLASKQQREVQASEANESVAQGEAFAALRREMHDSVLHALQRMGSSWSSADEADIRRSCAEAAARLKHVPSSDPDDAPVNVCSTLTDALRHKVKQIHCETPEVLVPRSAADALVGAAREAVRNTLKHADTSPVVRLTQRQHHVTITVADEGPGFDVKSVRRGALGLSGSIHERMRSVGGDATLNSGDDGTTVALRWPAPPRLPDRLGERTRRQLSWVPLPLVLASAAHLTVIGWNATPWRIPLWIGLVAVIAWGSLRIRQGMLKPWQAALMCVVGLFGFSSSYLWLMTTGTGSAYDMWTPTLLGGLVVLALPGQPVRVAISLAGLVVGVSVLVSVITLGWSATLHSHFGALLAVLLNTLVTLVLVFGAAGVSRHVHVTRNLAAAAELRLQTSRIQEAVWLGWLERANELTADFLDDVASGRRPATSEETRVTAARLGARLRDELRLWPGDTSLAEGLDRLRGQGWDARLLSGVSPASSTDELERLLAAFDDAGGGHQVLVSVDDENASVTVTPALTLDHDAGLRQWLAVDDPDFTQFKTALRGGGTGELVR